MIDRSTTQDTPSGSMALYEVAFLFGTSVAETILASAHVRAHPQAGHMDASAPLWSIRHKTANSLCDLNGLQTASINERRASRKPLK